MTYFIDNVRSLIEQNEVNKATDKLLTVLKNGSKEILDRATLMSPTIGIEAHASKRRKSSKITTPNPPSKLKHFLVQLEKNEPMLVKFLSHIELAEQKNDIGDWKEAKSHFESAFAIHDDSFSLSKNEITNQIQLCKNVISFNSFIALGNKEFLEQKWKSAKTSYIKALEVLDRDFNTQKVEEQIAICEGGIRFEEYVSLAKLSKSKENWVEASEYFNKALELRLKKYYPKSQYVNIIDELRKCSIKAQKQSYSGSEAQFNMKKEGTTLLLLIGILAFLALYLYYPDLSNLLDQELAEQSTPTGDEILAIQDSVYHEMVIEKAAVILADSLPIDSLQMGLLIDSLDKDSSLPIQNKEELAYKEEPQIDIIPEISNIPTPNQIRQLIKPRSDSKKSTEEIIEPKAISEEIVYEKGRIAIIPFCHENQDVGLAKRVYMDASFAIRNAGKAKQSAVSKNLVQGVIQKLGLRKNNFCSETGATEIARFLKAESVLIGSISHLPNNQIRIVCEILHVPSLRYSGEIILTDTDLSRLRNKLKQEIQQVFN